MEESEWCWRLVGGGEGICKCEIRKEHEDLYGMGRKWRPEEPSRGVGGMGDTARGGQVAAEAKARGRCQVVQGTLPGDSKWGPSSIGGMGGCPRAHPRPTVQTLLRSDHPVHRAQPQGERSRPAPAELVAGEGSGLPCRRPG